MRTIIIKWGFIPAWLLVLLYPWPSGHSIGPVSAACLAAMCIAQTAGQWHAGTPPMVPCTVRREN
jgi:hypothetical protein